MPHERHVARDLVDRSVCTWKRWPATCTTGRHVVLVDPRDARLRARVAGDEADEQRDHDRVREQRRRAGAASGAAPSGPCAAGARRRSLEDLSTEVEHEPPVLEHEHAVRVLDLLEVLRREADGAAVAREARSRPPRRGGADPGRATRSARRAAGRAARRAARARHSAAGGSRPRARPTGAPRAGVEKRSSSAAAAAPRRARPRASRRARGSRARRAARSARAAAAPSRWTHVASTTPSLASIAPARIASSVDLPAPFGPTSATASPATSSKSVGASASTSP